MEIERFIAVSNGTSFGTYLRKIDNIRETYISYASGELCRFYIVTIGVTNRYLVCRNAI